MLAVWSRRPAALVRALAGTPLLVVLAVAVAVRVLAGLAFAARSTDEYEFGVLAQNVVAGRGFSYFGAGADGVAIGSSGNPLPSAFMPPAWTGVVVLAHAVASAVGGGHELVVWLVRLVSLVLACLGVAGMDALGREAWSPAAGRLAALGFALYPPFVYLSTQVSAANAYIPLEIWLLVVGLRVARRPTTRGVVCMAVATGVLCLLRSEGILYIALLAVWLFVVRPGTRRAALRSASVFLVVAAVLPGAWMIRNSITFDRPVTTITTTGGFNLWLGNNPGATGSQKSVDTDPDLQARIAEIAPDDDYELELDAAFREAAVDHIVGEPGTVLLRDAKKVLMLLTVDWHDDRSANPAYVAAYGVVLLVGSAGLVRFARRPPEAGRSARTSLLLIYVAVAIAVPAVFFTLARYKLPIEMILLLGAGIWLSRWADGGADRGDDVVAHAVPRPVR